MEFSISNGWRYFLLFEDYTRFAITSTMAPNEKVSGLIQ